MEFTTDMGWKFWKYVNESCDHRDFDSVVDEMFPGISGGDRVHRHVSYGTGFTANVPNWTKDLLWQTENIQSLLYRHQHPANCSGARFLVPWPNHPYGIGSWLHVISTEWKRALREGRILTYHSKFSWYPKLVGAFCGDKPHGDCLFEPLTNCSITSESDVVVGNVGGDGFPPWIAKLLQNSMICQDKYALAWFWKAQVIGYMCRLNNRTLDWIQKVVLQSGIPPEMMRPGGFDISMHVRQSDVREWRTVNNPEYASVLYMMRKILGRDPTVFLATDSDESIEYFSNLPGFKVYTIKGFSRGAFSTNDEIRIKAGDIGSLYAWADLYMLAHGNILIGTLTSNVIRLVMELRAVQYEMASNLMMEVGQTRCVSMAHCEHHGIPWKFDWNLVKDRPWLPFRLDMVLGRAKGDDLRRLFENKLSQGPLLPDAI
jgi:hypothetical protein